MALPYWLLHLLCNNGIKLCTLCATFEEVSGRVEHHVYPDVAPSSSRPIRQSNLIEKRVTMRVSCFQVANVSVLCFNELRRFLPGRYVICTFCSFCSSRINCLICCGSGNMRSSIVRKCEGELERKRFGSIDDWFFISLWALMKNSEWEKNVWINLEVSRPWINV